MYYSSWFIYYLSAADAFIAINRADEVNNYSPKLIGALLMFPLLDLKISGYIRPYHVMYVCYIMTKMKNLMSTS